MDEDTTLRRGCRADIAEDVTEDVMGEPFCEDCVAQIEAFLHGLRADAQTWSERGDDNQT